MKLSLRSPSEHSANLRRASVGTFNQRVAVAMRLIRTDQADCREFDNCFEMHDGEMVGLYLALECRWDHDLRARILGMFTQCPESCWLNLPAKYPDIAQSDCERLAAGLRRRAERNFSEIQSGQTFMAFA